MRQLIKRIPKGIQNSRYDKIIEKSTELKNIPLDRREKYLDNSAYSYKYPPTNETLSLQTNPK